jgi:hypothetical protein
MVEGVRKTRRVGEANHGEITIPQWAAPLVATAGVIMALSYVNTNASEDATKKDQIHVEKVEPRFKSIEREQVVSKLRSQNNSNNIADLKELKIDVKRIERVVLRIGGKLDVETD